MMTRNASAILELMSIAERKIYTSVQIIYDGEQGHWEPKLRDTDKISVSLVSYRMHPRL